MILVTVHTYNGANSDTDEVQLLGIYSNFAKARTAVYQLMKYYVNQYLTNCNVFPGRIEDQDLDGFESIQNIKTLFPHTYKQVEDILRPTYHPIDIDLTYSIDIDDRAFDFKNTTYNADLPTIYLGGSKSIKED